MAAPQTPMSLQDFANAITPAVRQGYLDVYETHKPKLDILANVEMLEDYGQLEANFTGLGIFELTNEAEAYKEDSMLEGFTTTYIPYKYTKRVPITEEMITFDKVKITDGKTIGSKIAEASIATTEAQLASVFNNGFSGSYVSYSDGVALFGSHTSVSGGSAFVNYSTSQLPLTPDNLAAAIATQAEATNDRGLLISLRPKILLVPPALEQAALEITKSTGKANTAENNLNVLKMREYYGGLIDVVVWPYLAASQGGSDTAWFLLSGDKVIQWKWAIKPQLGLKDTTDENKNGVIAYVGKFMSAVGWGNPRGIWGSQGTGV